MSWVRFPSPAPTYQSLTSPHSAVSESISAAESIRSPRQCVSGRDGPILGGIRGAGFNRLKRWINLWGVPAPILCGPLCRWRPAFVDPSPASGADDLIVSAMIPRDSHEGGQGRTGQGAGIIMAAIWP